MRCPLHCNSGIEGNPSLVGFLCLGELGVTGFAEFLWEDLVIFFSAGLHSKESPVWSEQEYTGCAFFFCPVESLPTDSAVLL